MVDWLVARDTTMLYSTQGELRAREADAVAQARSLVGASTSTDCVDAAAALTCGITFPECHIAAPQTSYWPVCRRMCERVKVRARPSR